MTGRKKITNKQIHGCVQRIGFHKLFVFGSMAGGQTDIWRAGSASLRAWGSFFILGGRAYLFGSKFYSILFCFRVRSCPSPSLGFWYIME